MNSSNSFIQASDGVPCTCLCSTNSEISSGTVWNYTIFHNTAKNVKEPPLSSQVWFQFISKLWLFHSEEFRVVSLLCSHQADFSHKCRSVLHSFSSFVLILFCNYFPCSYWSSLFHTKKWKWQKQTWGVWRLAGVTSTGRQQCRNVLQAHVKHLLSSTHGASIGSDIIISL